MWRNLISGHKIFDVVGIVFSEKKNGIDIPVFLHEYPRHRDGNQDILDFPPTFRKADMQNIMFSQISPLSGIEYPHFINL